MRPWRVLTLEPSQRVVQLEVHAGAFAEVAGDERPVAPVVGHRAGVKLSVWGKHRDRTVTERLFPIGRFVASWSARYRFGTAKGRRSGKPRGKEIAWRHVPTMIAVLRW